MKSIIFFGELFDATNKLDKFLENLTPDQIISITHSSFDRVGTVVTILLVFKDEN